VENGLTTSYGYNAVNELTSSTGTAYTYDARGNLTTKVKGADTWSYTYDKANRLLEAKKNNATLGIYTYDANGIRAKKVEHSETTIYLALGHKVLYEKTGAVSTKHIFADSQRIAAVTDGVISYFHNDHLGSTRAVTSSSGTLLSAMSTKPFGETHSPAVSTDYLFTGKELDDTGLYYFASRYYDASVGRFTSQDPHWNHNNMIYGDDPDNKSPLIAAITQSTNLYVYCTNNPLIYVDPDGEVFFVATGILGVLIGGVGGAIHSYVNHGEVRWQSVATGAAIGGAIGLTGGIATGYLIAGKITASTGTVLLNMGLVKGGAIVIGETMSRVQNQALKHGAEYYTGLNSYSAIRATFGEKTADAVGLIHNAKWLVQKMLQGCKILDVGINVLRDGRSPNYAMEKFFTQFYDNIHAIIVP